MKQARGQHVSSAPQPSSRCMLTPAPFCCLVCITRLRSSQHCKQHNREPITWCAMGVQHLCYPHAFPDQQTRSIFVLLIYSTMCFAILCHQPGEGQRGLCASNSNGYFVINNVSICSCYMRKHDTCNHDPKEDTTGHIGSLRHESQLVCCPHTMCCAPANVHIAIVARIGHSIPTVQGQQRVEHPVLCMSELMHLVPAVSGGKLDQDHQGVQGPSASQTGSSYLAHDLWWTSLVAKRTRLPWQPSTGFSHTSMPTTMAALGLALSKVGLPAKKLCLKKKKQVLG